MHKESVNSFRTMQLYKHYRAKSSTDNVLAQMTTVRQSLILNYVYGEIPLMICRNILVLTLSLTFVSVAKLTKLNC